MLKALIIFFWTIKTRSNAFQKYLTIYTKGQVKGSTPVSIVPIRHRAYI